MAVCARLYGRYLFFMRYLLFSTFCFVCWGGGGEIWVGPFFKVGHG